MDTLVAVSQSPPAPKTTPLLEALKAEKLAQKDRETILRSHAHYKDAGASKREEAKKKADPLVQAKVEPAVAPTPVPLSKKARKAAAAAAASASTAPIPLLAVVPPSTQDGPVVKQPANAPKALPAPSAGHGRHRAKEHRQTQLSVPTSTPAATEDAPGPTSQRKTRPVVGLGRHFEAALNGAVAVSPPPSVASAAPDRKKRDTDKGKRREDAPVVPSILQRPEEEVVMVQRAVSPKVAGGEAVGNGVPPGAGASVRGSRRGRGKRRGSANRGG